MDAQTCLKKMQLAGTLSLATVDESGAPQIRCVSAVHYEPRAIYFLTARGKEMARQLMADGRVQTLVHTRFNEMIRMSGVATPRLGFRAGSLARRNLRRAAVSCQRVSR